ncbi:DUF2460 domain-containing protein [bacterium]|nr:DUF2460 domain-containing protein [bacterium]
MPLASFTLDYLSCEETFSRAVLVSAFENGAEQRRARHEQNLLGFTLESTNLTKTQMQAYRAFYEARGGMEETFTFTSPFDDTAYTVRFNGNLQTSYAAGVYSVKFAFVRVI